MFTFEEFDKVIDNRINEAIENFKKGYVPEKATSIILGEISAIIIELYDAVKNKDSVLADKIWELKAKSDDFIEELIDCDLEE